MTLKARLLIGTGAVAVLMVVAAVVVTRTTTAYLVDQLDAQLVRLTRADEGGPRLPPEGGIPPDPQGRQGDQFSTLYLGTFDDGALTTRLSPELDAERVPVPDLDRDRAERIAAEGVPVSVDSNMAGTRYRVLVGVDRWSGGLVVVGLPQDDVDATIGRLVVVELITSAAVLALLGLITWWVLHLGVRPIRRMTAAASTIAAGDLSARIPEAPRGTEAAQLGDSLNVMLGRIEGAFAEQAASEERLRRFLADASHELRTPVTTIRGYAELYRLGGLDEREQLASAMGRTEAESIRMGNLVEDMLTLARLDDGRSPDPEPVRLDRVAGDVVADLAVVQPAHPVTTHLEPATVPGVPDQLHQVVANLVTNAAVHTPTGTPIEVSVHQRDTGVRLVVADRGPGMDPRTATRAFERFYRADTSRSRASGGSGLGLAIVAAVVQAHGGTVRIESPGTGTGTTVVVDLPGVTDQVGSGAPRDADPTA